MVGASTHSYEEVHREESFVEASILEARWDHPTLTPDLWAKNRGKKRYDVYQIWDAEGEGIAAYEVMRTAITPNIGYVCIVTLAKGQDSWNAKYARKFVNGVLEVLEEKRLHVSPEFFCYANLDADSLSSRAKVRRILVKRVDL